MAASRFAWCACCRVYHAEAAATRIAKIEMMSAATTICASLSQRGAPTVSDHRWPIVVATRWATHRPQVRVKLFD